MNDLERAQQRVTTLENQLVKMKDHELLLMNRIKRLEHCIDEKLEDAPKYVALRNREQEIIKREIEVNDSERKIKQKLERFMDLYIEFYGVEDM